MVESVEIEGLRGIKQGKLEGLTSLTMLVGPNGCGKSTVLDALLIGTSPMPGHAIGFSIARRTPIPRAAPWFFWRADLASKAVIKVKVSSHGTRDTQITADNKEAGSVRINAQLKQRIEHISTADIAVDISNDAAFRSRQEFEALPGIPGVHLLDT